MEAAKALAAAARELAAAARGMVAEGMGAEAVVAVLTEAGETAGWGRAVVSNVAVVASAAN